MFYKKETLQGKANQLVKYNYSDAYLESYLYASYGSQHGIKGIKEAIVKAKQQ